MAVADAVKKHLEGGNRVLLLLSGGSGIAIAIEASKMLQNIDLSDLSVSLTDERYGNIGHKDENWQQILDFGFKLPGANLYRPLINQDINQTTTAFAKWLKQQLDKSDYKIGIFGIGSDGHTAGVKPRSPALDSKDLTSSFVGDDFDRITITPAAIRQLNEAIVQASGVDKQSTIHELMHASILISKQPAQILKMIPKVALYTNIKEEK
jgi:6-phosphogluconolactonase/glucosamine-6-phosphate isomerase/deaminase